MEAEGLDKTGKLRHEVTMQFIKHLAAIQKTEKEKRENLDVSPQGTALTYFSKSANKHQQIYTVFVDILRRLSNNLGPGLLQEAIDKLFDDASKLPTRNDLVKLSMKLWIAMFPPPEEEDAKSDQNVAAHFMGHGTGGQAKQLKNKAPTGAARPLKQIVPLLREAAALHRFRRSAALRRRRRHDSEMVKHVTVLGVSLCAAYFLMTSLKTALINTIDYFDNTVTIFGAAVLLYLATLYTIEKRFKKVTETVTKPAQDSKDNKAKTKSDSAATTAIFEALIRPTKAKVMDIESYRQFMEELRGVKLELADVYDQYTEYRTQMEKIKDRHGLKGDGYGSSSTTTEKYGMPRERTQTEEYGNLRRTDDVEQATTTNNSNNNNTNNDDDSGKKKVEIESESEKKPIKEIASKLPMPGFYESRTKAAKKPH
uniref:CID domain-containing protein n=1 Tax=Globodera pallida TaxID=36090 RepID=A0A183BKE8_GLOPA